MESPGSYRVWDDAVQRVRTVSDLTTGPVLTLNRADRLGDNSPPTFEKDNNGFLQPSDPLLTPFMAEQPFMAHRPFMAGDTSPGPNDATRGEMFPRARGIFSGDHPSAHGYSSGGTRGGTSRQSEADEEPEADGTSGHIPALHEGRQNSSQWRVGETEQWQPEGSRDASRPGRPEERSPEGGEQFPGVGSHVGSRSIQQGTGRGSFGGSLTDLLRSQSSQVSQPVVARAVRSSLKNSLLPNLQDKRKLILRTATSSKKVRFDFPPLTNDAFFPSRAFPATSEENPLTVAEAKSRSDWPEWQHAMKKELEKMVELKVWSVENRPAGRNIIKCKWVFVKKLKSDGTLDKYKARLVARGFTQEHGIDYTETFAPTVQLTTVRLLLAYAAANDWEIHQIDVIAAYLHAELDEELYMELPDGYEVLGDTRFAGVQDRSRVVRLLRALYGLKQSARQWNQRIVAFLLKLGFRQLRGDTSCFVRGSGVTFIAVVLHVDDQNILSPTLSLIIDLKRHLAGEFGISDEGDTQYFLGLQVFRNRAARRLKLAQPKFIAVILKRFGQENSVPVGTPLAPDSSTLHRGQGPKTEEGKAEMQKLPYRAVIGSLMYLMVGTRPDLAYPLGRLSAFLENPGMLHWEAALRVLRYVRGTAELGLVYGGENTVQSAIALPSFSSSHRFSSLPSSLVAQSSRHVILPLPVGWCDASFAEDVTDRKSTGAHVFTLYGAAISWRSKKQSSVARSTVEAEYVECSEASAEAMFLSMLIGELGLGENISPVIITVHSDSQGALALVQNPVNRHRTKHIDIHFHFVRDLISKGLVKFEFVRTENQTADFMTKVVTRDKLRLCAANSGMGE